MCYEFPEIIYTHKNFRESRTRFSPTGLESKLCFLLQIGMWKSTVIYTTVRYSPFGTPL